MKFDLKTIEYITRSILILIIIVVVLFYGRSFIKSFEESNLVNRTAITKMVKNIGMMINQTANKSDFKDLIDQLKDENNKLLLKIKEQQKTTKEVVDEIGIIKGEIKQTRKLYQSSTKTYDKEGQEYNHYEYVEIKNNDAKIAWAMYYPNRELEKRWKFGTFPLTAQTTVIETENRDGTYNRYAEIDVKDKTEKKVPLKVKDIKWEKIPVKNNKMFWLNPRISLDTNITNDLNFGLGLSLSSYGRTENDMIWRFFNLETLTNTDMDDIIFSLQPISWNVGEILPLVENMFVGPSASYKIKDHDMKYGLGLSIPF